MQEKREEKAVFVGIIKQDDDERKIYEYLDELQFLAETAGAVGDKKFVQRVDRPDKATYIRSGKLQVLSQLCHELDPDLVIFHNGLSIRMQDRIADICGDAAWALTCQVRSGSIRRMWFEEGFGHGGTIPAVEVPLGRRKVCIRGVIDRLDMMDTGDGAQPALRVVDYKTGGNKIDEDEIRGGYQLQLMVYLDAARAAWKDAEPAGIFYFKIKDHIINGDEEKLPDPDDPSDLEAKIRKFYRMEGITINDPAILEANDAELSVDRSGKSNVINASYDRKNEVYKGTKATPLLEREEFRDLLDASVKQVEDICRRMISGEIQAAPHRGKQKNMENKQVTACTWCGFRSICMFDTAFRECRYVD